MIGVSGIAPPSASQEGGGGSQEKTEFGNCGSLAVISVGWLEKLVTIKRKMLPGAAGGKSTVSFGKGEKLQSVGAGKEPQFASAAARFGKGPHIAKSMSRLFELVSSIVAAPVEATFKKNQAGFG